MAWVRVIVAYLAAVVCTTLLLTIANTQFNILALPADEPVSFADRLSMTLFDIGSLAPFAARFVAGALLVGLPLFWFLLRPFGLSRTLTFVLAGFMAISCFHLLLKLNFSATILAGSRHPLGMLAQLLSGAVGGWVYARLSD